MPVLPVEDQWYSFALEKKLKEARSFYRYEVRIHRNGEDIPAIVHIAKQYRPLDYTHIYRARLDVQPVPPKKYDYQFDYQKYLARQGIYYQGFITRGLQQAALSQLTITQTIRQHRLELLMRIDDGNLTENVKSFLKGIILADRTSMDEALVQDFNRTGLVHILAISGTHVVLIYGLIFGLLSIVSRGRWRRGILICSLVAIWVFSWYIGFGSSVVRACYMLTFYHLFRVQRLMPDVPHAMALSAFAILLPDPFQLFDVGFQLSYLAVAGIFWLNGPLLNLLPTPRNTLQKWLLNIPTITLSAQLATLPLILYYFHQFSPVSLVANLVVIPVSELLLIFSLLMTVGYAAGFGGGFWETIYSQITGGVLDVIHWFGSWRGFEDHIPFGMAELVLALLALVFLRAALQGKHRAALNMAAALGMFFIVRGALDIYAAQQEETKYHEVYRYKAVTVKKGAACAIWIADADDSLAVKKSILLPYMTTERLRNYRWYVSEDAKAVRIGDAVYALQ